MYKVGDWVEVSIAGRETSAECLKPFMGCQTQITEVIRGSVKAETQYHLKGCTAPNGRPYFFIADFLKPIN